MVTRSRRHSDITARQVHAESIWSDIQAPAIKIKSDGSDGLLCEFAESALVESSCKKVIVYRATFFLDATNEIDDWALDCLKHADCISVSRSRLVEVDESVIRMGLVSQKLSRLSGNPE